MYYYMTFLGFRRLRVSIQMKMRPYLQDCNELSYDVEEKTAEPIKIQTVLEISAFQVSIKSDEISRKYSVLQTLHENNWKKLREFSPKVAELCQFKGKIFYKNLIHLEKRIKKLATEMFTFDKILSMF